MQDASGRETGGESSPGKRTRDSVVRAHVRHRSEWLKTHGYVYRRGEGVWSHGTGDLVTAERIATIGKREWPALRDWIARQNAEIAAAAADVAGTVE